MKRILIIDDNSSFRKMLKVALKKDDYEIEEASDAVIGCDLYFQNLHDLIIMDLFLPEKDGIQAIHEIKEECTDVKIIAVSGASSVGRTNILLDRAHEHGADIEMKKPVKIKELLSNVEKLLI
jgi:DNA-binding response OmpR family regulator